MRIVKVRIRAGDPTIGENQLIYPARYNPIEVDRLGGGVGRLNKINVSMSGDIGRGGNEEFMYVALPDSLAREYAQDPDMMIVDSTTADTEMEQWRINNGVPEEVVDPNILNAIKAKQDAGIPLTQANLDALDPTKPARGINKARANCKEVIPDIDDDLTSLPEDLKRIGTPSR